jgi:hypothetical protein
MNLKENIKKFKDSKAFQLVKNIAPEILDQATDIAATIYPPLGIVNAFVDKAIDVAKAKGNHEEVAQLVEVKADYEVDYLEHHRLEVEDRKDARLNGNRHLQIVVAYFSLAGFSLFGGIQMWLCYKILASGLQVNEFVIMTASNIFGLFTGLIFTLKDFLFGGSADKRE